MTKMITLKTRQALCAVLYTVVLSACGQQGDDVDATSSAAQQDRPTLSFTAIPDQDEQELQKRFDKIADYLQQKLNVPVRYIPVKSYAASVAAFGNNQVQLAWFGGLTGIQARQLVPGSQAIVQGAADKNFRSYFIANVSTGLEPGDSFPRAIAGKTFTFGSKGSTSGRLMPEHFIREAFGKTPDEVFQRVGFSGDHSRTIQLVQSGAYQVGAVNYAVWNKEKKLGRIDASKVNVIWKSPPYSDYQWSIRGDVNKTWGDSFKAKVTQALLDMQDPSLLQAFPRTEMVPASNEEYDALKQTGKQIGVLD